MGVTFPSHLESPIKTMTDDNITQISFPNKRAVQITSAHDATSVYSNAAFKNLVENDPNSLYYAEKDRYHLYINLGCPWSMSTYSALFLKGLQECISVSCTKPEEIALDDEGNKTFVFDSSLVIKVGTGHKLSSRDLVNNCETIIEIYQKAAPQYSGPFTLPILWDKRTKSIVSNDSLDIVKMFNNNFNPFAKHK